MTTHNTIEDFYDSLYLQLSFDNRNHSGIGRFYIMSDQTIVGHGYLRTPVHDKMYYYFQSCKNVCAQPASMDAAAFKKSIIAALVKKLDVREDEIAPGY